MSLRSLVTLAAAALALGLLAFLVRAAQGRGIDPALNSLRLEQLTAAAQLDIAVDQEFERARLSPEAEPVSLADLRSRLGATRQALQRSFDAPELGAGVKDAAGAYLKLAGDKEQLAATVQARLREFDAAFTRMRQQGGAALEGMQAPSAQGLRRSVMALVGAAGSYGLQAAPDNAAELEGLLAAVNSGAGQVETGQRAGLYQLVVAVQALRTAKDAMQARLDALHAARTAAALDSLRGAYLEQSRFGELRRERGRLILGVYAGALFIAFGVLALRLRKSFGELDRANGELQGANETLEQRIAERTRDLSKALEDLRLQQAHLIQSEKMASLGQMVAGVAHEINTPLGYARSNVQTVRELMAGLPRPDAATAEMFGDNDLLLGDAEHGLERISELVLTLKDFSRVDRSRTELFNVNDGLDSALKICNSQIKDRVEVKREYGEVPLIPCAPSQLNQVFLNLVTNAAQAIEGPGSIVLATRARDGQVEIRVRDSGCGMDQDVQAHIFEPFFTTKPVGKGTGLGLSIVFRIVEDHGGSIAVESAPGAGAEFIITLPVKRTAATQAEEPVLVP
jgi:signal transduction histidine kinase